MRRELSGQRQKFECSFPTVFIRWKDQDVGRHKRGGCCEREKQRGKRKQEGATKKPQREEKDEEGEEALVDRDIRDEWK